MQTLLQTGILATSHKEGEKRLAIHPEHISLLPELIRKNLFLEEGYGKNFGVDDSEIKSLVGGIIHRNEILKKDIVVMPKPSAEDMVKMKDGSVLWGWAHCVQQEDITQTAIDKRLTVITWESMNNWTQNGDWEMHIFYKNNEIAGYAGVIHALGLVGQDGSYGSKKKAAVINLGSVSRGAVHSLKSRGFEDITVYLLKPIHTVSHQIPGATYKYIKNNEQGKLIVVDGENEIPFIDELSDKDVIVNGILQNPNNPLNYVEKGEETNLKKNCLIIDISCDEGMGFWFAKPTTFKDPMFKIDHINYYSVDHTPSYLFDSATWEISKALIPFLKDVLGGESEWEKNEVIRKAIEIKNGEILNRNILTFQNREDDFPHTVKHS